MSDSLLSNYQNFQDFIFDSDVKNIIIDNCINGKIIIVSNITSLYIKNSSNIIIYTSKGLSYLNLFNSSIKIIHN